MEEIKRYKLSEKERKELQNCLLEIYCDIANVCKKHNLQIMLGGGSCLGAVRHKGFIPWDDDMDLNMHRKDYNKLLEIFDEELGEKYELIEPGKTKKGNRLFAKVMKKNTTFIENNAILSNTSNGVFVDIFPIEFLPNNPLKRKFFLKIADFLTKLINIISAYQFQTNKNILKSKTKLIGNLLSFWSFYKWHDIYTWFISHSNGDKYCTIPSGRKGVYGELQPVDVFFPLTEGLFEGIEVKLPQRYDSYLTSLYDDYMQLPPENKRDSGHYLVKFSLTEDRYTTP